MYSLHTSSASGIAAKTLPSPSHRSVNLVLGPVDCSIQRQYVVVPPRTNVIGVTPGRSGSFIRIPADRGSKRRASKHGRGSLRDLLTYRSRRRGVQVELVGR